MTLDEFIKRVDEGFAGKPMPHTAKPLGLKKIKKGGKLRGRNIFGSNSYPQPIDKFNKFITAINKLAGSNIELVEDI